MNSDINDLSPKATTKINRPPKLKDSQNTVMSFRNLFTSSDDRDNQLPIFKKKVHMTREQIEANTIIKFNRQESKHLDSLMMGKSDGNSPTHYDQNTKTVAKDSRLDSNFSSSLKPIKINANVDQRDLRISRDSDRNSVNTTVLDESPKASKYTDEHFFLKSPRASDLS